MTCLHARERDEVRDGVGKDEGPEAAKFEKREGVDNPQNGGAEHATEALVGVIDGKEESGDGEGLGGGSRDFRPAGDHITAEEEFLAEADGKGGGEYGEIVCKRFGAAAWYLDSVLAGPLSGVWKKFVDERENAVVRDSSEEDEKDPPREVGPAWF